MNNNYRNGRGGQKQLDFDRKLPTRSETVSEPRYYSTFTKRVVMGTNRRLVMECDAAERRRQYSNGQEQFIELPAGVKVEGEWVKGKKRYGTIEAVRKYLKENK